PAADRARAGRRGRSGARAHAEGADHVGHGGLSGLRGASARLDEGEASAANGESVSVAPPQWLAAAGRPYNARRPMRKKRSAVVWLGLAALLSGCYALRSSHGGAQASFTAQ